MIGVEPTRREALAPETSVSTISPHGLSVKWGQIYEMFFKYEAILFIYITISHSYTQSQPLTVMDTVVTAQLT